MWKDFAPRLRKSIVLSLEDAQRRGHAHATGAHLLAVIARDPIGAASLMLRDCGVDIARLAEQAETSICSSGTISAACGFADQASRDFQSAKPQAAEASEVTVSDETMKILARAGAVARERGDNHVGTEHVLLALSEDPSDPAGELLRRAGATIEELRPALDRWVARGMPRRIFGPENLIPRSPLARSIFRPVARLTHVMSLAYRVFAQHSLGHPRFASNPYPLYHRLRARHPLRRDPIAPIWVALRYDDVVTLLRDPRFQKEPFLSDALGDEARRQFDLPVDREAAVDGEPLAMLFLDPPRHTRIRAVFNQAFVPRTLYALRPRIQQIADSHLDEAERRGTMDVICDLAVPLPIKVIAELVGFPPEDYPRLKKWSDDFAAALTINPTTEQQKRSNASREEMRGYFEQVVANLREKPGENLICTLLNANENDQLLSPMELFANCVLLMAAGHETTTNLIGNGVLALLRNPNQVQLLRENPSLISSAIDELLRFDSPVQWVARMAAEKMELRGQKISRGEIVIGSLGAANRDPEVFNDPDRLDIRREKNRHIAFGHGEHYCIGAMLARLEGEIAIGSLIRRFPKLRLARKRVRWNRNIIFRGLRKLAVSI